jgi:hypothetical protein
MKREKMKLSNGTSISTLLKNASTSGTVKGGDYITLYLKVPSGSEVNYDPANTLAMVEKVTDVIQKGVKPSATFEKELAKIDLHSKLLVQSYVNLFESYEYITNPQTRTSPADKAMLKMLSPMKDTMLKNYAQSVLGDEAEEVMSDIILPDDRTRLITIIMTKMRDMV